MHQKLLTIKDTLLSSQTSHPPQQSPHKPCRNHHKATRPTLPHQPRNHKTTIPEPASRTSQPHHHQSSSPENHTRTLPRRQTRQENIPAQPPPRTTHAAPNGPTHTTHTPPTQTHTHQPPEAFVWHASAGTQNRPGTAQLAAPGRIMIRTGQRVRAPTVFFPRRTRATRPHRKSSSVRR